MWTHRSLCAVIFGYYQWDQQKKKGKIVEAPEGTLQTFYYENDSPRKDSFKSPAAAGEKQEGPRLLKRCPKASLTK